VPLIHPCCTPVFLLSPFDNRLYFHSRQGLVMVDLLDNFLNLLQLCLAVTSHFMKLRRLRFAEGKARIMNGGPATATQVGDGGKS
jgi:hypothetical protein